MKARHIIKGMVFMLAIALMTPGVFAQNTKKAVTGKTMQKGVVIKEDREFPGNKVAPIPIKLQPVVDLQKHFRINNQRIMEHFRSARIQKIINQHGGGATQEEIEKSNREPADPQVTAANAAKMSFLLRWADSNNGSGEQFYLISGNIPFPDNSYRLPMLNEIKKLFTDYDYCLAEHQGKKGIWVAYNKDYLSAAVSGQNVSGLAKFFPLLGYIMDNGVRYCSNLLPYEGYEKSAMGHYATSTKDKDDRYYIAELSYNGTVRYYSFGYPDCKFSVRGIKK